MSDLIVKPAMWWPGLRRGHPLARDLVALWPLWEGGGHIAGDFSGNANHAILTDMDPATDWLGSSIGTCLDFDGSDDWARLEEAVVTDYPLTLSCWFNSDSDSAAQYPMWIGDKDSSTEFLACIQLAGHQAGDYIAAVVSHGSIHRAISTKGYTAGQWHHACAVFESSSSRTIYIDGGNEGTNTTSVIPVGADRTALGKSGDASPVEFDGKLALAMIHRRGLSAEEARELCEDPWGLITPRTRKIYSFAPAASRFYYLYRGVGGISGVDFSSPVATLAGGNASRIFTGLGHDANTRYTYVLRPARTLADTSVLVTPDMSCRVEFETDGAGDWLGNRPGSVEGLSAEVISGGVIRLRWNFRTPYGGTAPNDFGIYYSTSPDITPGSPSTTESYTADGAYSKDIPLSDGVAHYFAITARDATPVESHISEIIGPFIADDTAPDAPTLITATTF